MKRFKLILKPLTRWAVPVCLLCSGVSFAQTNKPAAPQWNETAINAFLTAELLSLDNQYEAASSTLWRLARFLKEPELYDRVAQWAMQAKRMDLAFSAAAQWELVEPNENRPQQLADTILLVSERFTQFSARLSSRYGKALAAPSELDLNYLQRIGRGLNLSPTQQASVYNAVNEGLKNHHLRGNVQYTLAALAFHAKLNKEAGEHLRAASLALPPSPAAIGALLQDEPAQATLSAIHWTQRDPRNLDAWRTLGLVHARLKQPAKAAEAFTQGLKIAPKDVPLLLERMDQLRLAGEPKLARESLLTAYAVRATIIQPLVARLLAEQLEDDYHYDKAQETYAAALTLAKDPEEKTLVQAKIFALKARRGDAASMAALLKLQANADEKTQDVFTRMALSALREQNLFDQALALVQVLPTEEAVYEQALTFELMGKTTQAEGLLREALRSNPNAAYLLNTLGYGLVDRNDSPAALAEGTRLLELALQASPESAAIMDSLGWAYFRAKDYVKAKPLLQKAFDLKRDPEVAAHLGELLLVTGNAAQARKIWAQALLIDPKHKILNNTLKRLNIKP